MFRPTGTNLPLVFAESLNGGGLAINDVRRWPCASEVNAGLPHGLSLESQENLRPHRVQFSAQSPRASPPRGPGTFERPLRVNLVRIAAIICNLFGLVEGQLGMNNCPTVWGLCCFCEWLFEERHKPGCHSEFRALNILAVSPLRLNQSLHNERKKTCLTQFFLPPLMILPFVALTLPKH